MCDFICECCSEIEPVLANDVVKLNLFLVELFLFLLEIELVLGGIVLVLVLGGVGSWS
jgi:hypothetical protein